MRSHSPIEIEHRFTTLEVKHEIHEERINKLEDQAKPIVPWMEPRDWLMAVAGIATILAAALGRIPWSNVLSLISKP